MTMTLQGRNIFGRLGFVAAFLMLLPAVKAAEPAEGGVQSIRYPHVTVSRLATAPAIDGAIGKTEWLSAAQSAPLALKDSGLLPQMVCCYWIGYTEDAIHLAFRCERPPYALKPAPEDHVEIFLLPSSSGPDYTFVLGADGRLSQGKRATTTDHTWKAPWKGAVRHTDSGWEGELSIPFTSLGVAGMPTVGTEWRMLFLNSRATPSMEMSVSSFLRGWPAKQDMGYLIFGGEKAPVVRVLSAGSVNASEVGAIVEVIGAADASALQLDATLYQPAEVVKGTVNTLQGGDIIVPKDIELNIFQLLDSMSLADCLAKYKVLKNWRQDLQIKKESPHRLPLTMPASPGTYLLRYQLKDVAGGQVVGSGTLSFQHRPAFDVVVDPYLLTKGSLMVQAEYPRAEGLPAGSLIKSKLIAGANVLAEASAPVDLKQRRTVLTLPASDRFGMAVIVETTVTVPDGNVLITDRRPVQLPNRPRWLANNIGDLDTPLPPWGPITLSGDVAAVPLRQIRFGSNGLPASITSRNKELLTAPMQLLAGGKEPVWTRNLQEQTPGRVSWLASSRIANVAANLSVKLEYDGMIRYDLTLDPGSQPADLRDLVLRIPYAARYATSYTVLTETRNFDPSKSPLQIKEFAPQVQLADMDTGLTWFAEWAKGWQIGQKPVFELARNGETVEWLVRFVGSEGTRLDKARTLTFGLMPLPARELNLGAYTRDMRHTQPYVAPDWTAEEATCELRYPAKELINPEQGTLLVRASWYAPARLLQVGQGDQSVGIYYVNAAFNNRVPSLWLAKGSMKMTDAAATGKYQQLASVGSVVVHNHSWQPVALTWNREGEEVKLALATVQPDGAVRSSPAKLPWSQWQQVCQAGGFSFGGQATVGIDEVTVFNRALPDAELGGLVDRIDEKTADVVLLDTLDELRLYQGKYSTRPLRTVNGIKGVAGGPHSGIFVEKVPGVRNQAILLNSGPRSGVEVLNAYGVKASLVLHEQFTPLAGYYYIEHMTHPALKRYYQDYQRQGLGVLMYGGFSMPGKMDSELTGIAKELALAPILQSGAGVCGCFATPAVDYYVWAWKQNIDYYAPRGAMYDNTINCRDQCKSVEHGCGWYDEAGKLQGRWPIFGARDMAKRMRWLWHVYVPRKSGQPGMMILHAGARHFPMVADFADSLKFGEGWVMGAKFELQLPEQWWQEGWQWRLGVPGDILLKSESKFSHNWLMMYGLLYGQPFRCIGSQFLSPRWWHIDPKNPGTFGSAWGPFNPYFSKEGVNSVAAPVGLWWQLQDDFDTHTAEFHGFWGNGAVVQLNQPRLRSSYYVHQGESALFIVANFDPANVDAAMTCDLGALGLSQKALQAYDAFTGEQLTLDGAAVRLQVPGWQYRIVRLEGK